MLKQRILEIFLWSFLASYLTAMMFIFPSEQPYRPCQQQSCNNDKPKGHEVENNPFLQKFFSDPISFFTFSLVLVTGGLVVIGIIQANAAKQSADIAARTFTELERPYIFVDIPKFIPSLIKGRPHNVQYVLRNYGRTPAIVRWLKASAQTEPPSTKVPTWTEIFNGQIVFKSGDEKEIEPNARMPVTYPIRYPVIRAIEEPAVLLIIEVTYSDVFDYIHVSEFTFFESCGSFHAIAGKKYNRRKSEKLPEGAEWTPAWSERQR